MSVGIFTELQAIRKLAERALAAYEKSLSAPWGFDHAGRPMLHPPAGNCYCITPGDGFDRCSPRTTSASPPREGT